MSKVFRRPMFRGGSTNMNGIMSGIEDRENYSNGTRFKEIVEEVRPVMKDVFPEYEKPTGFQDPVYQLAIQTGLDLMSKADSQNLLRNVAGATGRNTPKFFEKIGKERAAKRKYDEGIESASIGLAGDLLGKEISAAGRTQKMDPIEALKFETEFKRFADLGLPSNVTERAANFVVNESDNVLNAVGSKRYGGVLDFNVSDRDELDANKTKLQSLGKLNKIVYDPFENNYKRITIINGVPSFDEAKTVEELMQIPLPTVGEREEIDRSVPDFGMSIDDPSA